jgi:multisubunit Na+/H+ antiporter MnhC subunit
MLTPPQQRPLRQTLVLAAMVIAVTVLAAVILYAATEGLWLGIHGKL